MTRVSFLISAVLLTTTVHATDIYRWVDENGRTQISDTVPTRYKDTATKVDTSASKISEIQRQEAIERAAADKHAADAKIANRIKANAETASKNEKRSNSSPAPSSDSNDHCDQLMKAYQESQECFAPYIMRRKDGRPRRPVRVRPEAYQYCRSLPDPSAQCGLLVAP